MRKTMNIDQAPEPDYDSVKIDYVGFVDIMLPYTWILNNLGLCVNCD